MNAIRVALRYTDASIHPMHGFVCESPAVDREVLLQGRVVDGTRTLVFYVEGDREAYEAVLAARTDVGRYEVVDADGKGFLLYVREPNRDRQTPLVAAFERESLVVVPPIEFRSDRTARLTVVGDAGVVRAALDDLPDDVTVTVLRVGGFPPAAASVLSARQREAVDAAWAVGYYEVPRGGGIEAVAAELDCAVSTASELLRRAEASLVADVLGRPR